jgi:hypothetical protein
MLCLFSNSEYIDIVLAYGERGGLRERVEIAATTNRSNNNRTGLLHENSQVSILILGDTFSLFYSLFLN